MASGCPILDAYVPSALFRENASEGRFWQLTVATAITAHFDKKNTVSKNVVFIALSKTIDVKTVWVVARKDALLKRQLILRVSLHTELDGRD
jgi:hypothetical protein